MSTAKVLGAILMLLSSLPWIFAESKLYGMSLQKYTLDGFLIVVGYYMLAILMTIVGLSFAFPANLGLLVGLWEIIALVGIIFHTGILNGWKPRVSIDIIIPFIILSTGLVLLIYGSHRLQKVLGIL